MRVWAVIYCSCIFESAPETLSLHKSAVSAFNEMRRQRDHKIKSETDGALSVLGHHMYGEYSQPKSHSKGQKNYWWYSIKPVEVMR